MNKTKAATKDSKVAKPLAPKPDPSVVSTTSRSSINHASHLKRNPIAQPGDLYLYVCALQRAWIFMF